MFYLRVLIYRLNFNKIVTIYYIIHNNKDFFLYILYIMGEIIFKWYL